MKPPFLFLIIAVVAVVLISGCVQKLTQLPAESATSTIPTDPAVKSSGSTGTPSTTELSLRSSAISNNGNIPVKYTCDGGDVSPPLKISGVPSGAKSLALLMDDPDAIGVAGKIWDHWVVFNIDPSTKEIGENQRIGTLGSTSSGTNRYEGPCPPEKHSYSFRLYILGKTLDLQGGATKAQVESAIQGNILAQTELIGKYEPITASEPANGGYDALPSISSSKYSSNPRANEVFTLELAGQDDRGIKQFSWESSKPLSQGRSGSFDCKLEKACSVKLEFTALESGEQKITVYTTDSTGQQAKNDFNLNVGLARSPTPRPSPTATASPTTASTTGLSECTTNSGCGYKQICSAGKCVDVQCTTDSQCTGCKRCSGNYCKSCGYGPYGCTC